MIEAIAKLAAGIPPHQPFGGNVGVNTATGFHTLGPPSGFSGGAVGVNAGTGFHNPETPSRDNLGPVERGLDRVVQWAVGADSDAYKHYTANRNLWNIALPAAGLTTAGLLAHGVQNAFSGGGTNNQQNGGGGSSPWSWLLPLGIIGGGLWAWNKYGDGIMNAVNEAKQTPGNINRAAKAVEDTANSGKRLINQGQEKLDTAEQFVGYAADKFRQKVDKGGEPASDAYRQKQILGRAPVRNPRTGELERLQPRMTPSAEAVRQTDPTHMSRVHDAVRNSVYKEDGGPAWYDRLAQTIVGFFG